MIRILHVVGTMNRGGAETLIMELYRNIDRTKVQFDFFVYNYSDKPGAYDEEILQLGGKIFLAKQRFYKNPFAFSAELKQFFNSHPEYKIVHSHQNSMSGYIIKAAKQCGVQVTIAHSHIAFQIADFLRRCANSYGRRLVRKYADYVFGCSEDALVSLSAKKSDGKTHFVINNAINIDKFIFSQEQRDSWREQLGAGSDTIVLGNVARLTYQKNHEFLVKIFAEVVKQHSDSLLVSVGIGSKEQEIKTLAKELKVDDKLIFMGSRPDVNNIVNAFDVFVMPSRYEGLGIVLIEAQANGLPCIISSDVIPEEADVKAGLVTRVSLEEAPKEWAQACLNVKDRMSSEISCKFVDEAGFNISTVSKWLQDFYISNWK